MICSKNGLIITRIIRRPTHHPMQFLEIIMRILHIIWNTWNIKNPRKGCFAYYLEHLEYKEPQEGLVPDSTFFCFDEKRNLMVGAVNIRHDLNDYLLKYGGHIGDGIRPSERRKGYATEMIRLALEECRELGLTRVLMTCDKNNIGSAKSIIRNGGILENEVLEEGSIKQRYWIAL